MSAQLILCVVLLIACNVPEERTDKGQEQEKLAIIYGSFFQRDSIKAQPELAIVEYEDSRISATLRDIQEAESSPTTELPPIDEINRMYMLDMTYEQAGKVTRSDYYIVVLDNNAKQYIKRISIKEISWIETYDDEVKEEIIQRIGSKDWRKGYLTIFSPSANGDDHL